MSATGELRLADSPSPSLSLPTLLVDARIRELLMAVFLRSWLHDNSLCSLVVPKDVCSS